MSDAFPARPARPTSPTRPTRPVIGFIGFGEAGSSIAAGLRSAGATSLFAYDNQTDAPGAGPTIRARAARSETTMVASPGALAGSCTVLLSTVTSSSALVAATEHAPHLTEHH